MASALLSQPLLDAVEDALQTYGDSLVRQSGYVYQFHIKDGGPRSNMVLDLKHGSGALRIGTDPHADVTLSILDEDLVAMARGTLSTFNALRDGRLQIRGDQLASQVLADVMQRIERTRHRGRARVEMESDEVTMLWRVGALICCSLTVVLVILVANPWEMRKSTGGPHQLELIAHASADNLFKAADGMVKKLEMFNSKAFYQLFPITAEVDEIRPSDVFLVGALGSGTTWLSHIMHGLRSGGSMSFEDLFQAVAWYESLGRKNLLPMQSGSPRLFMSHRTYTNLPRASRYVVLMRDPVQVLQSQYSFFCNSSWTDFAGFKRGYLHLKLFAPAFFARVSKNEVWQHIVSWHKCCWSNPEVLWITYEDFLDDPSNQIRKLGKWLLPEAPGPEAVKKLVEQSTRSFMLQHRSKFDAHALLDHEIFQRDGLGLKLDRLSEDSSEVDPAVLELLEVRWKRIVAPVTGFQSYQELRRGIQARSALPGEVLALQQGHGSHLFFVLLLLSGLLAAFIGLQPALARSLALRFWITARSRYRRHFAGAKKTDPEPRGSRTGTGFIV